MAQQRLNLEEIGRLAGVSRSTVSRVVNGEPNVSDRAKRRVEAVIAETGYRPNAAARSLASNRTGVIGLVIPSEAETLFHDPYFGRLILGVTGAINAMDATLALFLLDQQSDRDSMIKRVVSSGMADGVIITATHMGDPLVDHLRSVDLPFVVVGRPQHGQATFSVDVDNRGGGHLAAAHLANGGYQRLGMIAPPSNTTAGIDRRDGFLDGVAASGLKIGDRVHEGDWTENSGREAMTALLGSKPDAVFVGSDRMAVGALRAIRDAGLNCPADIALVSFDGLMMADQTTPRLTSVAQPVTEVGQRAARLLNDVINGLTTTPEHVVFPTTLLVRESCGVADHSR